MALNTFLIAELEQEAANTRKMLERVPMENAETWKPHNKSMPLGRLATHIAELPAWISMTLNTSELDWAKTEYKPTVVKTKEELVDLLDKNVAQAKKDLEKATDEDFMQPWTMRNGEHVFFQMPKAAVLRTFAMNHLVHHRGQLSVYLRLNDVPLPGMYGPTADEQNN